MSTAPKDNIAATRQFIEHAWNNGRYELGIEHLAADFVNHTPFRVETREQFLERIGTFRTAFPDLHETVEEMLADADRVITRFTLRGTHRGPFRGIPATNRTISVMGIAIDRVVNAKRVEGWEVLGMFELMQQLGAVPQSGQVATQRSLAEGSVGVTQDAMTDPRAVAERWTHALSAHDIEAAVSCMAPDYRDEAPARRGEFVVGQEEVRNNLPALFHTVYAVDRRGRAASGDAEDYAIELEFDDVAAVVDSLPQPANLLGRSYGALCSLEAATRSQNVRKLVLYEPPIPSGIEIYPSEIVARVQALIDAGDREGAVVAFFREIAKAPPHELEMLRSLPNWPARVAAAYTIPREMGNSDGYVFEPERFRRLSTPTLLLLGGDSPPFLKAATEAVHAVLPNSQIVVLPNQQHTAMNTAPKLFVGEVLQYLQD